MTGYIFKTGAAMLFAFATVACADGSKLRSYKVTNDGTIQMMVPQSWRENDSQSPNLPPKAIVFSPAKDHSFQVIITSEGMRQAGKTMATDEDLKANVEKASAAVAARSIEKDFPIKEFKGKSAKGYYFVATDKAPKSGEYKYLAQGMLRTGELTPSFTILSNDATGEVLKHAIEMLKTASHVPQAAPTSAASGKPSRIPIEVPTGTPDAVTTDGGKYYGPMLQGKMHGKGIIVWPTGARYEGNLVNGLMSGKGKYQSVIVDYDGDFKDGMKSGHGRYTELDELLYVGEFANEMFNGTGRLEANGSVYEGQFVNGVYEGIGKWTGDGEEYQGQFKKGKYAGQGELKYKDGQAYKGAFESGLYHGKGRYETAFKQVYEGEFVKGNFEGQGSYVSGDGSRHTGTFLYWRPHGPGTFTDARGNLYEGTFKDGELDGKGIMTGKDGRRYEGEFKDWKYHGQGVLKHPNGDEYKGGFAYGLFEGEGVYKYAKPKADGRSEDVGTWRYGVLENKEAEQQAMANVEKALYNQRALLDKALATIAPREQGKINLFLLAVGGDGSQEVFRREVEFVNKQFDRDFGTKGHSVALINSRNTMADVPMATVTSIRESVSAIAGKMDKENDILFLYLTSHGSKDHKLTLDQNGITLQNLDAKQLGKILKDAGIRWKVVTISACYAGGFIDPLKDDRTMVITAARHDRTSFGCADENDFTYFGRAFFKESLSTTRSFGEAFVNAKALVAKWEADESKNPAGEKAKDESFSDPQIHQASLIDQHLKKWRAQFALPPSPGNTQALKTTGRQ